MDWLNILKSKTYGKLPFTIFIFSLLVVVGFTSSIVAKFLLRDFNFDSVGTFSILVLTWWTLQVPVLIFINIAKWLASYSPFSKNVFLLPKEDFSNLIWHGDIDVLNSTDLLVTRTDRGILFKNVYWKDFIATFSFKFVSIFPVRRQTTAEEEDMNLYENYLGFIFRAIDLDNYFMIQIGLEIDKKAGNKVRKIFFRPHVRINGEWENIHKEITTDLTNHPFHWNKLNKVKCVVKNVKLTFELNDQFLGEWNLPTHSGRKVEKKETTLYHFGDTSLIPFRYDYGMIGFRASGQENAIIKDIKIEQL